MTNANPLGAVRQSIWRRTGEDILALTAGAGVGAGLMYLCDPKRGRARRTRLAAEARGLFRRDKIRLGKRGKNWLNRMRGAIAEAASALTPEEQVTDDVLIERVRSRLGHIIPQSHEIQVHAREGVVTLEGKLGHAEQCRLRREIGEVPGVKRVDAHLAHRRMFNPGLLMGLAAGLAMFRKAEPAGDRTTADKAS